MDNLKRVQESIRAQWDAMIDKGVMPLLELQTSEDDYLIVEIQLSDDNDGFVFSFDKDALCDVFFSGEIERVIANNYQLTIDECFENLDSYLEQINNEMLEGYLLPNNLYYCEG